MCAVFVLFSTSLVFDIHISMFASAGWVWKTSIFLSSPQERSRDVFFSRLYHDAVYAFKKSLNNDLVRFERVANSGNNLSQQNVFVFNLVLFICISLWMCLQLKQPNASQKMT